MICIKILIKSSPVEHHLDTGKTLGPEGDEEEGAGSSAPVRVELFPGLP